MLGVYGPTVKVPDTEHCPHYTLRVARGGVCCRFTGYSIAE